jgi:hypothetical protein
MSTPHLVEATPGETNWAISVRACKYAKDNDTTCNVIHNDCVTTVYPESFPKDICEKLWLQSKINQK